MITILLNVNDMDYDVDVEPDVKLLWVLREYIGLTGTKYGCGIGQCGACTVHIDGQAVKSCQVNVGDAVGKKITTIEGLPADHPVKAAWKELQVPQCGYCQPGQIMQAAYLISQKPNPTDEDIDTYMNGNLCRCGTYPYIREAIKLAAKGVRKNG